MKCIVSFLLNELNNADKHRLITVVTAVPASYTMVGTWVGGGGIKRGVSLYLNAKVGSVPPPPEEGFPFVDDSEFAETGQVHIMMKHEVDVETTITPGVLFGSSCDAVKGLVVIPTIRSMADEVSSVIESFVGKF